MSGLWCDGPDHYGTNDALLTEGVYADASNVKLVANSGPGGVGTCFQMSFNTNPTQLRLVLPGERSLVGMGVRFFVPTLPSNNSGWFMDMRDNANNVLYQLRLLSTGALQICKHDGTGVLYTSPPIIVASSFQFIEWRMKLDAADGGYSIGVNSLPVASSDGLDTGSTAAAQIVWGSPPGMPTYLARDIYAWDDQGDVNNSGMQGDRECITSLVNADGSEQDWAYSAGGSGWPLLSNVPPDDTQFVYSDTAGDKSDFGIDPISTDITSISWVRLAARAWKSDAGIGTMSLNLRSGAAVTGSVEQALSTEKIYYSRIIEKDPNTTNKFTPVGLNAALPEIERVQ